MIAFSVLDSEPDQRSFVNNFPAPYREIDSRAIRRAMRLFKGDERQMFRMAVDGMSLDEIAAKFSLHSRSTAAHYVNGLLWRARCDRILASELGVVA